jgi:hypothetical protein
MRRRGVILVTVLFLVLFLAILGTHLFYLKMMEHRTGALHTEALQAFEAAQAGLEDARVKLSKNPSWPYHTSDQKVYVYTSQLDWDTDVETNRRPPPQQAMKALSFRVAIEWVEGGPIILTAWGLVGDVAQPIAQRELTALYDPASGKLRQFADWGSY